MKRSELELNLLKDLRENSYIDERDQYGELIVKHILDFVEKAGMPPPEIVNPKIKHLGIYEHAMEVALDNLHDRSPKVDPNYYVNEWETE